LTKSVTQRIQERAYEIFLKRERDGRPGDSDQDWREAEKEIAAEDAKASKPAPAPVKQAAPAPVTPVAPKVEVKAPPKVEPPKAEVKPVPKVEPKIEPKAPEVKKPAPAPAPAPAPVKKAVVAKKGSKK